LVEPEPGAYDAIVLAVAHSDYQQMGVDRIRALAKGASCPLFDLKGVLAGKGDTIRL
jgi:UDP-N-acetyl-D-galactosamine dehydrogenase